jgi:hypothetical protein
MLGVLGDEGQRFVELHLFSTVCLFWLGVRFSINES